MSCTDVGALLQPEISRRFQFITGGGGVVCVIYEEYMNKALPPIAICIPS